MIFCADQVKPVPVVWDSDSCVRIMFLKTQMCYLHVLKNFPGPVCIPVVRRTGKQVHQSFLTWIQ